jgi:hypothetical protein
MPGKVPYHFEDDSWRFLYKRLFRPYSEWERRLLAAVIVASLLVTFLSQSAHIWDRYRVVKDVQNFYWMARYQDPTLFATDYLWDNRLLEVDVRGYQIILFPPSLGYALLFYLASFVIDHIWLSKLLIFVLMPICVTYLFKLGKLVRGDLSAISLSLVFVFFSLASRDSVSVASGLQRAFAVPLLIVFMYSMVREQYILAGLMIVMSALFYWPNFPLTVLAYGLSLIKVRPRLKMSLDISRSKLLPLLGSLLLSTLLIALQVASEPDVLGSRDVPVLQDPSHQTGGATPMFISFPWLGRGGVFETGNDVLSFIALLGLGVLVYKTVGRRSWQRLPDPCWHLVAAGAIMYLASFFLLFGLSSLLLYLPSRYTRSTLFLFAICYVGLNWGEFLEKGPDWFRRNARLLVFFAVSLIVALVATYLLFPARLLLLPLLWFMGLILSGAAAVLGGSSLFWLITRSRLRGASRFAVALAVGLVIVLASVLHIGKLGAKTINPSAAEREVYEFVGSLPKDAVLVGDPVVMSGIPLFSGRNVLFRDLHPNINPNAPIYILDYFDAQYAESGEAVLNFCQRYKISHLVLDVEDFDPDHLAEGDFFYQPWNDRIVETVAGRSDFVLLEIQPVFASGPFEVIECDEETILAGN